MEKTIKHSTRDQIIATLSVIFLVASISFDGYMFWLLRNENASLKDQVELFGKALESSQKNYRKTLSERDQLALQLGIEKQNSTYIQNQIQDITSTVGQLKKLSETDVELLKKYSKVYFLNENYIPPRLTTIDSQYLNIKTKEVQIHSDVWPHLESLLIAAQNQGIPMQILSGYRSFSTQATLKSEYKVTYGSGANKFSADQGYSEHQLGTTLDFTTEKIGPVLTGFEKTTSYTWLIENAYRYGFVLSYPKNNAYYVFEPWHWRFVGVALATKLHDQNINFYDAAQRLSLIHI